MTLPHFLKQRSNHGLGESLDQSRGMKGGPDQAVAFAGKLDEKNICVSPTIPGSVQNPVESDTSTATTFKAMDHHSSITNKAMPVPMLLQPNFLSPVRSSDAVLQVQSRLPSDAENISSKPPQSQLCQTRSCTSIDGAVANDKLKEQELTIEGGTISISSAYSQGLVFH